jgi:N-ethylmaleimide reductase
LLSKRQVLAPLTRNRATEPGLCPHADHAEYYAQRATPGGLLITEVGFHNSTVDPSVVQ